jgi:hypothetical protein
MSTGRAVIDLWRRARPFRVATAAAAVSTVLAFVSAGQRTTPPAPTPTPTPNKVGGGGGGGGGGSQPPPSQSQSCGPQGVAQVAAPVVVSQSGNMPSNVQMQGGTVSTGGIPADVQARFTRFVTQVDAATREQREGESCARMEGAVGILNPQDFAWADCFADGKDKLVLAQDCEQKFAASEARFARLEEAYGDLQDDRSAPLLERLANARAAMTDFDRTRERWNATSEIRQAGNRARTELDASTDRIQRLTLAAQAPNSDTDPDAMRALAAAGALTSFDRARLDTVQQAMLERSQEAARRLDESDDRFNDLGDALSSLSADDPASRESLIAAVSRLTSFDLSRATPTQLDDIEKAKSDAASFALQDLVRSTADVDPQSAPAPHLAKLRDLRSVILENGGSLTPSSEQQEALEKARMATVRLEQSDQRIANMREMVERVQQGGPAALGDQVLRVYEAISDFDISRMSDEEEDLFERLAAARDVTIATEQRELTRDVPMFIRPATADPLTQEAVDSLRSILRSDGYSVVDAEEQSAVTVSVDRSDVVEKSLQVGSRKVVTAEVTLRASAEWTFAGEAIRIPSVSSDAFGGAAAAEAVSDAARGLAEEIFALTVQ